MVMQTAGEFSLLEVSGNMLVWHFLDTGLKEVDFLRCRSRQYDLWFANGHL